MAYGVPVLKVAPLPLHGPFEDLGEGIGAPPPVRLPSIRAETEVSYDWLFASAAQPMLIVDADNCIARINAAAARLLHASPTPLVGSPFLAAFSASSTRGLAGALSTARVAGSARIVATCAGAQATRVSCGLSLIRAVRRSYILVHLDGGNGRTVDSPSLVAEVIENAPVGFLMTDAQLHLEYANQAFLKMIEADSLDEVYGQPLGRWLGLAADDLAQMEGQMSARRAVSMLFLRLTPEHGAAVEVEALLVAVPHKDHACWGLSIRSRPRLS